MIDPTSPNHELAEVSLSAASSRLDASLLRYVLLFRSRMNMLALDRELRGIVGERGRLQLPAGVTRSSLRYRAEATMQFAVELELARPEVVRWVDGDAQRRQKAIDAAYYQAERWKMGRPPVLGLGPESLSASAELTTSPMSSRRFALYLWARSRLEEENKATTSGVDGNGAGSSRGSPDQEDEPRLGSRERSSLLRVKRDRAWVVDMNRFFRIDGSYRILCSIAAGVAERLKPHMGVAVWRRAALACVGQSGFRTPPPELFDALLVERRSLIAPGAFNLDRYEWQFTTSGERRHTLRELSTPTWVEAKARMDDIEAAGTALISTLGLGGDVPIFTWLADGVSLLPTTPAWADVLRAMRTLRAERPQESTRGAELDEEIRTVADFHSLLTANLGTTIRAICAAAYVAGSLGSPIDRPRLRLGLLLLSQGLAFPESEGMQIDAKLTELGRAWSRLTDAPSQNPGETPWPPARHSSLNRMEDLGEDLQRRLIGATLSGSPGGTDGDLHFFAYEETRMRLVRMCTTGLAGDASLQELWCAARSTGPAQWISIDPRNMRLWRWSQILLACIDPDHERDPPPTWLAVIALQRLGVNTLGPMKQERLLSHLIQLESGARGETLVADIAKGDGVWRPGRHDLGTVLLVRKELSPLTVRLHRPPTRGLVLVLTAAEIERLIDSEGRNPASSFLRALPRPLNLRFEQPLDDGVNRSRLSAAVHAAVNGETGWPKFRRRFDKNSHELIDETLSGSEVQSADDFFDGQGSD